MEMRTNSVAGRVEVVDLRSLMNDERRLLQSQFNETAAKFGPMPRRRPIPTRWKRGPGIVRSSVGAISGVYSASIGCLTTFGAIITVAYLLGISVIALHEVVRDPQKLWPLWLELRSASLVDFIGGAIAIGVSVLLIAGYYAYQFHRVKKWAALSDRMFTPSAYDALLADKREPVVLLRSFTDDNRSADSFGTDVSLEQLVCDHLQPLGPSIAIGEPREWLPPQGAARDYVTLEDWQSVVAEWCLAARAIIMFAGQTPGLAWEFTHISGSDLADKLLVLVPPVLRLQISGDFGGTAIRRILDEARVGAVRQMITGLALNVGAELPAALDPSTAIGIFRIGSTIYVLTENVQRDTGAYECAINFAIPRMLSEHDPGGSPQ